MPRGRAWWPGAVAGLVAAALALAAGEFAARLLEAESLVRAIGDVVVDASPRAVSGVAIETFGTNNKPALLSGVVALSLALGALLGPFAMRRRAIGVGALAAFALAGGLAAMRDPFTSPAQAWTTAAAAGGTGVAALLWLLRMANEGAADAPAAPPDPRVKRPGRRRFLQFAGGGLAAAAISVPLGRRLIDPAGDVDAQRAAIVLPPPGAPTPASREPTPEPSLAVQGGPASVPGISPLVTPNSEFYRIDTRLSVPRIDSARWRLRISGMVERPAEFTFDELLAMDLREEAVTLACVSNEVGGELVGTAYWLGVPLPALLRGAGVQAEATQVVGRAVDGFTVGFPTDVALDGRESLVVFGMNGEPLPARHGFPARLIVPGLYGYVSATKWLGEIELSRLDSFDSYWVYRGWAQQAPIKLQSRIDVPRGGQSLAPGKLRIAGVAWGGLSGVSGVQVRVSRRSAGGERSDGAWTDAELGEELSDSSWRQWVADWVASEGVFDLQVRAIDRSGMVQTAEQAPPFPDGATGHHTIRVRIRA